MSGCPCCNGSSSSSSGSSSSGNGCTCCWTAAPDNNCCGCCCVHVPPTIPMWTRDLFLNFTGGGPCDSRGGNGQPFCQWGGFSNVWEEDEIDFGGWRKIELTIGPQSGASRFGGLTVGNITYDAPDGYDWGTFCSSGSPVVLTLSHGDPASLPATIVIDPVGLIFTGPGPDNPAPCECLYRCAGYPYTEDCPEANLCVWFAHSDGAGGFDWDTDDNPELSAACDDMISPGSPCMCDDAAKAVMPLPTALGAKLGLSCTPRV